MCGVIASNKVRKDFSLALQELQHRGPDYVCIENWSEVQIGFCRLAIRGLGNDGNQPFFCECGRWSIIYNGEISNWSELMTKFAFSKNGTCDGQIIAPLLCHLGVSAFSLLKGMFAIIAHDRVSGKYFGVRDPFGIKPLYLWQASGQWSLSSEIQPLLKMYSPKISLDSMKHFFTFGFLSPRQSGFENLTLIEPGKILVFDLLNKIDEIKINLFQTPTQISANTNLKTKLSEIIAKNCESDITMALAYSSGFDSNLIATLLSEQKVPIQLIHIASSTEHQEAELVEKYAARHNLDLSIYSIDTSDIILEDYFTRMDRLTFDGLNSYLVSRAVSFHNIKTFLTGHGGDEFLRGYKFAQKRYALIQECLANCPSMVRKFILNIFDIQERSGLYRTQFESESENKFPRYYAQSRSIGLAPNVDAYTETRVTEAFSQFSKKLKLSNQDLGQIFHYLAGLSLLDLDQYSMSFSIEARPPIVDFEILRLLREEKISSKSLLAQKLEDKTLMEICKAPKKGFSLDLKSIIEKNLDYVVTNIQSSSAIEYLKISKKDLNELIDSRQELKQGSANKLWQLLTLCKWFSNVN